MRYTSFLLTFLFFELGCSKAQFLWAEIGVDGLTCSACTRSVEMSVLKLNFVDSAVMNLEHTQGKIYLKKNNPVSIEKIAQAVVDAGFSVRFLRADFDFTNIPVNENHQFTYENTKYKFITPPSKPLTGETIITFIGKNFLSKKEFSHWKAEFKNNSSDKTEKVYHIIL